MAAVVDYIVYMTYDLHGQWDYGSGFANPVSQAYLATLVKLIFVHRAALRVTAYGLTST